MLSIYFLLNAGNIPLFVMEQFYRYDSLNILRFLLFCPEHYLMHQLVMKSGV
jgi:hypothetical protein